MTSSLEGRIRLVQGDITRVEAEAIVTAANKALRGGGGVDAAVHRAAGPRLVEASMAQAPCPAGKARITDAFDLAARFVIHAVGPIFHDLEGDSSTLASAYRSALTLAAENDAHSIAFPCISTGVYGFPPDAACVIATDTVLDWLKDNDIPESVTFCCFSEADYKRYKWRLEELGLVS